MDNPSLTYQTVCAIVGKLFVESTLEIERLSGQVESLRKQRQQDQEELAALRGPKEP